MPAEPGTPAAQQVALGPGADALVRTALAGADHPPEGQQTIRTGVFVVDPPFFGNGDIGRLAVCGVVNELVATGAVARQVAVDVIVEAGLPVRLLERLTRSVREAAREAAVTVAAVDTKVVRLGEADQIFVAATAFGAAPARPLRVRAVRPGDRVLVTAPLGDHAAHILAARGAPGFEHYVPSDCAPLGGLLTTVLPLVRYARPVAGGGLSAVLRSWAADRGLTVRVREAALPVRHETRVALGLQGVDPWDAACAGALCLFVPREAAPAVLERLRAHPRGRGATAVGEVTDDVPGVVQLLGVDGVLRVVAEDADPEQPRMF